MAVSALLVMAASASFIPARLRCEYLVDPIGLDEPAPRLSWIIDSADRGARQTAYRILVATTRDRLKAGRADLWDSGKVVEADSVNIVYRGRALEPGERAYWTVLAWDGRGVASAWAKPAFWERGISDWSARWIGAGDAHPIPIDEAGAHWIWYPEGDPAQDAPPGVRFFRTTIDVAGASAIRLGVAVDDAFRLKIDGREVASGRGWQAYTEVVPQTWSRTGRTVIEIAATNDTSRAGLLVVGKVVKPTGGESIVSNNAWEASQDGVHWVPAKEVADVDAAPYGKTRWVRGPRPATYLTKTIQVVGTPNRSRIYASAKGLYALYVDGRRIGEDELRPGWTDYRRRIEYQAYDATALLKPGRHEITMVLGDGWYAGHVGLTGRENYGAKPMGLCQIEIQHRDGPTQVFGTDESWRVGEGPVRSNDLLMGENYDARIEFAATEAPLVEALDPTVPLVPTRGPAVRGLAELKTKQVTEPAKGVYIFDLGQNMVGWARLRVRGNRGDRVTLRFGEMLNPDGSLYTANLRGAKATDTYTLKGSDDEVWEPHFTFHGFRYVELTGYPGKPSKDAVTGIVIGSDIRPTGTFECSSVLVNQLWHNIFWGQRGNYLEVPTDCPQRDERLGWMGDAQIFARTATYNNDVAAFMTKWLRDVVDAQSTEGGFSDVSPRIGDLADGAPAWGDAGVIVPWTMYQAYSDRRLLEDHYPSMKAWVEYIDAANPDHLWIHRRNNDFGDWLNVNADTPREVLATAYFAHSTDLLMRAALELGKITDAKKYGALLEKTKQAFVASFVDKDGRVRGDTQTGYALALWFNLLPESLRGKAGERLIADIHARGDHLSTGFVGVGYLNPTLTSIGANDLAYKLLLTDTYPSWGYSIRQGATTIWERWDGWTEEKGFQDPGMNSFNHYALGSVGEWLYSTVLGIDLDPHSPGFREFILHPQPGPGMTWAKGSYDGLYGKIESEWRTEKGWIEMKISIPANTSASVVVPTSDPASVLLDGERVGRATLRLGAGTYTVRAKFAAPAKSGA